MFAVLRTWLPAVPQCWKFQEEQERRTLDLFLARHQALECLGGVQQVVAELCRQLAALLLDLIEALLALALPQVTGLLMLSCLLALPAEVWSQGHTPASTVLSIVARVHTTSIAQHLGLLSQQLDFQLSAQHA